MEGFLPLIERGDVELLVSGRTRKYSKNCSKSCRPRDQDQVSRPVAEYNKFKILSRKFGEKRRLCYPLKTSCHEGHVRQKLIVPIVLIATYE